MACRAFFEDWPKDFFDEDDVRRRANELADFVTNAGALYGIASPIALGYSNGSNIAAAVLLLRPSELAGAILLRATSPLAHPNPVKLDGVPVLIVSGARDPIIQPDSAARLASLLERYGATVEHQVFPVGHDLSQADVTLAQSWWNTQGLAATNN